MFLLGFFLLPLISLSTKVAQYLYYILTIGLKIGKGKERKLSPFKAFLQSEGIITLYTTSSDDGCETCGACAGGHETRELNSTKCELCLRGNFIDN